LLPIQEKSPEVKVTVNYPDSISQSPYFIRLAQDSIDYWVKLDVKNFKGKTVSLEFEGLEKNSFALKNIKQSDSFDFDYKEKYRPAYHFTPVYGWMNDPNGMVYLDGEYHLFYQYNPFGAMWGNMHWGHAVSTDLTSWTYLPVAIGPDSLGAIFSGSAVIDKYNTAGFGENAMVAIYTSAGKVQTQSIAYSTDKGRTFTKYDKNPVIANPDIPDFRDPKVFWHKESNQWVMALATKQTITFYGSPNLKEWSRLSEFGEGIGDHGGVWECPDLFPLSYNGKTKWVLLVSINPGGPNGGSATQYFVGDFDGKTFKPDALPYPLWIDYGRDNYAGVTWSNIPEADGRRIFIGWMSNWDYANQVPSKYFRSANTVPRELKLASNGNHLILTSYPVKEINALKNKEKNLIDDVTVKAEYRIEKLLSVNEGTYEIEFTLQPENTDIFGFSLENTKNEKIEVKFDKAAKQIILDRRTSGLSAFKDNFASEMKAPLTAGKEYRIRLLVDKASVELFVNEGETVMTSIFFPTENMNTLRLFTAKGEMKVSGIRISGIK
ncbi:MAG TPA: GH32 C-terminal domain-containing protein, partial [Paludibacteraceae bacterium]|nr:GH32 C-terminal domain-containing protein [Paludibacteraceae bacterium]